jgi:hypothetical protein
MTTRPVEAAGPVDHAQTAWPTGPWKTIEQVFHSSHRPFFLRTTEQKNRKR